MYLTVLLFVGILECVLESKLEGLLLLLLLLMLEEEVPVAADDDDVDDVL